MLVASLLFVSALMTHSSASTPSRHPLADRKSCPSTAAKPPKEWKASLNVKNDSGESLTLRAGAALTVIEPGRTAAFLLHSGESIVVQNAAAGLSAGAILATVSPSLNNTTLHILAAAPPGLTGKSLL